MRVILAIDEQTDEHQTGNLTVCLKWALERAVSTGRPIKILIVRPGAKLARVIAEAIPEGVHAVHAGKIWRRKKLERICGKK